ncbi:MAG: response regulator [Candidatus Kapabacteria bacterium]|nr:response regulator [Candidatus Kapabacteria bacterium]
MAGTEQNLNPLSVLVVEDDATSRHYLVALLKKTLESVYIAVDGRDGLNKYLEYKPDIVLSDIGMPVMNGLEMSRRIKKINPKAQIILTTAFDNKENLMEAINIGISQYLVKPVQKQYLFDALNRISEIINLEAEVQRQNDNIQTLSNAIEHSSTIIVLFNKEELIEYCNPITYELTEYTSDDILNKPLECFNFEFSDKILSDNFYQAFHDKKDWRGEIQVRTKGGLSFWSIASISPVKMPNGSFSHIVLTIEDITLQKMKEEYLEMTNFDLESVVLSRTKELQTSNKLLSAEIETRKKTEIELIAAKELADAANQAKSLFLAKVSHELRTPLNGIIGVASLLIDSELNEKQLRFLRMIQLSSKDLLKIINDILDYTKLESGKLQISIADFSIYKMIDRIKDIIYPIIENKNLEFIINLDSAIPDKVKGDQSRIQQSLINLISNSIKFTNKGSVRINLTVSNINENIVEILFEVNDTGIGIPANKRDLLFKSFSQIDDTFTRKYGGTGLGLAITKELVEQMGGSIDFESEESKGSKFFFLLKFNYTNSPLQKTEEFIISDNSPDEAIRAIIPSELKILVAEDSYINQEVIREGFCKIPGWEIVIVNNGLEAVEAFKTQYFDIILTDISMPVMDGYEAAKIIRELWTDSAKKIPIIGFTAHNDPTHLNQCLENGMDSYISKPFKWNELFDKILEFTKKEATFPADISGLMISLNNNKITFEKLVRYLLVNYPEQIGNLNDFFSNKDFIQANQLAHKMKSEFMNFGATEVVNLLAHFEHIAAVDSDTNFTSDFKKLEAALIKLESYLLSLI